MNLDTLTGPLPGTAIARALHNALAHCPARGRAPFILITSDDYGIDCLGTDGYTAGLSTECWGEDGPSEPTSVVLTREDAAEVEQMTRTDDKGRSVWVVTVGAGQLVLQPSAAAHEPPSTWLETVPGTDMRAALTGVRTMVLEAELREPFIPAAIAFTPEFMGRWGKTKTETKGAPMDLLPVGPLSPVLVKVGPSFRGLIMPVDREVVATAIDDECLF